MQLKVLLPTRVLVDEEVESVAVEARDGAIGIRPGHQDLATAIDVGLLSFVRAGGDEEFVAVGEGLLVKVADEVLVSTRKGVRSDRLGDVRRTIEKEFLQLGERERTARTALARMEASFVDRLTELDRGPR